MTEEQKQEARAMSIGIVSKYPGGKGADRTELHYWSIISLTSDEDPKVEFSVWQEELLARMSVGDNHEDKLRAIETKFTSELWTWNKDFGSPTELAVLFEPSYDDEDELTSLFEEGAIVQLRKLKCPEPHYLFGISATKVGFPIMNDSMNKLRDALNPLATNWK